jgi:4-amino-4-deoxy-L-arabinose transferase-like glycosyltransferase
VAFDLVQPQAFLGDRGKMMLVSDSAAQIARQRRGRRLFQWALAVGLVVRLMILWQTPSLGTQITDEEQYSQLAGNIVAGNGFAWRAGSLTSIRPPLYPGLVAAIWAVAGSGNLQAVRVFQILLAIATTGIVYLLGARTYNPTVGRWAAAVYWLYPSFIFFNFLILTETLFTFLLLTFLLLAVTLVQSARTSVAALCGITLGLAALTRSILWPLPLLLCPLLAVLIRGPLTRRLALPGLVLIGYVLVVAPWAIRNTRLQGVLTVVDTMGGMNLRMGNYEYTPDDRMWDAVSLSGEKSWVYGLTGPAGEVMTEGKKDKWAQRKAIEYMRAHPRETLRRSLIKFADFWGLEREFIAGVGSGLFAAPVWFQIIASFSTIGAYVLVVTAGAAGMWMAAPQEWRIQALLLLPIVFIAGVHTVVFGHSRYHLPLIPILALYGTAFVITRAPSFRLIRRPTLIGATVTVAALVAIWVRQVAFVDVSRIGSLLHHVG